MLFRVLGHDLTIAVMGCRVNGPGETDDADLGMWCAPSFVNLKRGEHTIGQFTYDEILGRLRTELDRLIEEKRNGVIPSREDGEESAAQTRRGSLAPLGMTQK